MRYNGGTVLPLVTERWLYGCAQSVCAGGLTEEGGGDKGCACLCVCLCALACTAKQESERERNERRCYAVIQWRNNEQTGMMQRRALSLHLLRCMFALALHPVVIHRCSALQYPENNSDFNSIQFDRVQTQSAIQSL